MYPTTIQPGLGAMELRRCEAASASGTNLLSPRDRMQFPTVSVRTAHLAGNARPSPMESLGTLRRYGADERIYRQDEFPDYWYRLVGGAARKCTQISDGRRQIVDFLLPGDLFGFHTGDCSVECVVANTTVVRYPRREMESLMEADMQLAREVREFAFESIHRMQSRVILLGRSRAMERVCGFLLEMAHRAQIESLGTVSLPMSRYDIADYLALAVETVSRSLTTLRSKRLIAFLDTRHFRILDRKALEARSCR
jgi:CRP/FNR family transcriptional regulator, nitrogen fixation regulation protein